tara:strand:- start:1111 stop:2151 length:1041 start_codon:yes stop_codon:yes gene_type:complete
MAIDNDPIFTLDILGGDDLATDNCVLRQNKTKMICRGSRDYCHSIRDEMVVNRGYTLPPYYQDEWTYSKGNNWTPKELTNLETWFSPEYFHPETTRTDLCVQMENQSTATNAGANGIQNTTTNMATFDTDSTEHRGLTTLTFNGSSTRYLVDDLTDWNVGTDDWFCCVAVSGPTSDTDDKQTIVRKGTKWSLCADWTSGAKNLVFDWNDGTTSGSITLGGGGQTIEGSTSIYVCGRNRGYPFLNCYANSAFADEVTDTSTFAGDLDASSKPKIGYNITLGTSQHFYGRLVEVIFVNDNGRTTDEAAGGFHDRVVGYLAHKYKTASLILDETHPYYTEPPRLDNIST